MAGAELKSTSPVPLRALSYRFYLSVCFFSLVLCSLGLGHSTLGISILALADICFCGDILFRLAYQGISCGRITYAFVMSLCVMSGFIYSACNTFFPSLWQGPCTDLYLYSMLLVSVSLWMIRRGEQERERARLISRKVDDFLPKSVRVRRGGTYKKLFVSEVKIGDEILVNAGERIAIDGVLVSGEGSIDEQLVTGNILPTVKQKGSRVYAGTLCKTGPLHIRVSETLQFSVLTEVMQALKNGEFRKLHFQAYLDNISLGYLLVFGIISIGIFVGYGYFVSKSVIPWGIFLFLMGMMCPLVLPFTYILPAYMAIRAARKNRIYVQHFNALSVMDQADVFFFDKTGTLTYGELSVSGVYPVKQSSPQVLMEALATAEQFVSGPFSKAILEYARQKGIAPKGASYFEIFAGQGVTAIHAKQRILAGSLPWLAGQGFKNLPVAPQSPQTIIGVVKNNQFLGYITLADQLRPLALRTLTFLEKKHKEVWLVSGDHERSVAAVAQEAHIQKYNFEVLPKTKAEIITNLQALGKKVVMVGDGFNDILALLNADSGFVFASGKNVYNHWVDVVIKRKDLYPLVYLFKMKQKFSHVLWQNRVLIVLANACLAWEMLQFPPLSVKWYTLLGVNLIMLLLILLNSIRMLRVK